MLDILKLTKSLLVNGSPSLLILLILVMKAVARDILLQKNNSNSVLQLLKNHSLHLNNSSK